MTMTMINRILYKISLLKRYFKIHLLGCNVEQTDSGNNCGDNCESQPQDEWEEDGQQEDEPRTTRITIDTVSVHPNAKQQSDCQVDNQPQNNT